MLRHKLRLRQKDVAAAAGCNVSSLVRLESGTRQTVSVVLAQALAHALSDLSGSRIDIDTFTWTDDTGAAA